ncbi:MAG: cytochrome c553, partial [Rhodothermales bacterium]
MRIFRHMLTVAIFATGLCFADDAPSTAGADSATAAPAKVDMKRGARLYALCVACHGDAGHGNRTVHAPAIAGLPAFYVEAQLVKFRDGIRGAHPDDRTGLLMRPMARTLRTESDLRSVAAHVAQMAPAQPEASADIEGDVEIGKTAYMTCMACHGDKGQGNEALKVPSFANSNDWYLLAQLKKFKAGIRGSDSRDLQGAQMTAIVATLADEEAMKNVIA